MSRLPLGRPSLAFVISLIVALDPDLLLNPGSLRQATVVAVPASTAGWRAHHSVRPDDSTCPMKYRVKEIKVTPSPHIVRKRVEDVLCWVASA